MHVHEIIWWNEAKVKRKAELKTENKNKPESRPELYQTIIRQTHISKWFYIEFQGEMIA